MTIHYSAEVNPERKVVLVMDPMIAIIVLSQMQLASRHPLNVGASRKYADDVSRDIAQCVKKINPELSEVVEQGFDPQYDVQP